MKRAARWSEDEDDTSSGESSTLDTDTEEKDDASNHATNATKKKSADGEGAKKKSKGIDFEALNRHGYKGGLSVLKIRPPKEPLDNNQDWSWSTGKETRREVTEETFEERQRTRTAIYEGEQLQHALTSKEKKNLSFSQKEKRKRDMGQASRGKNYVEEEKRLLRESGVYSGFDS